MQFVSGSKSFSCSAFPPSLSSLIGGVGKYWVGKYLHQLGQCDGAWWVVTTHRVAVDACVPYSELVAQGSLLTLELSHFGRHHPQAHPLVMSLTLGFSNDTQASEFWQGVVSLSFTGVEYGINNVY